MARPLSGPPSHGRRVRPRLASLDGPRLVGACRRDRQGHGRRPHGCKCSRRGPGPQVAWTMARGYPAAFAGKAFSDWWVWGVSCALFFARSRRPAAPALRAHARPARAALVHRLARLLRSRGDLLERSAGLSAARLPARRGRLDRSPRRGRAPRAASIVWPTAALLAAAIFLLGFRAGVNVQGRGVVIDVGYAGVIGADRILHGQAPYGHMPVSEGRPACGPPTAATGRTSRRTGVARTANPYGDTYGPVSYLAYVPAVAAFGWDGRWDSLPAAHAVVDRVRPSRRARSRARSGSVSAGRRLAAVLVFAWEAFPFTAYAMNSDTNDAIMPALLVWGFLFVTSPYARGAAVALAGWTKFAALAAAPLWLTYPRFERAGGAEGGGRVRGRDGGRVLGSPARAEPR